MKIAISRIPQEGFRFLHQYNPGDLDLNSPDMEFKKPISIDVYCYRVGNTVSVEIDLNADFELRCSRCLDVVQKNLKRKMQFSYIVKPRDSFIDIASDIREEVILSYPPKPLCKEDCKGLCVKCGKNLNEGKCECE